MENTESFSKGDQYGESFSELGDKFLEKLPLVEEWIDGELKKYGDLAKPVSELDFENLGLFFQGDILNRAKVIQLEKVTPMPVATEFGMDELIDFENMSIAGITYKDTYFVDDKNAGSESLHFHELVHVIQWDHLGARRFLEEYGKSLLENGYTDNVFEEMARRHQRNFEAYLTGRDESEPYDVVQAVQDELDRMFPMAS